MTTVTRSTPASRTAPTTPREQPAHQTHALLERELAGQSALGVDLLEWDEDMGLHMP